MINTLSTAQTIIGSLSREAYKLLTRSRNILFTTSNCRDKSVLIRLENERKSIQRSRYRILKLAKSIKSRGLKDDLSIEFLIELCTRSVIV